MISMEHEISENTGSENIIVLAVLFLGFWFGFTLGTGVTGKFSKHAKIYKVLRWSFPTCFLILVFLRILQFASIPETDFEWVLPTTSEQGDLFFQQILENFGLIGIIQIPFLLYIIIISIIVGFKNEEGKIRYKISLIILLGTIFFMLFPIQLNSFVIALYIVFHLCSAIGLEIGIEQKYNTGFVDWISRFFPK